jgi:chorismate mutase
MGVLSSVLAIFAQSGANILTINQSIPTNGTANVTISAETAGMDCSMEELLSKVQAAAGVVKIEILAA